MRRGAVVVRSELRSGRLLGNNASNPQRSTAASGCNYRLGNPGRPAPVPTLLIAVFDNSGSVASPLGTDPLSNRFAEVARAFTVVARRGTRQELGAVLHFDSPTGGDVPPVLITKRGLTRLRSGLCVPVDGAGSSELGPSLNQAAALAEEHGDHQATLVVLSDFLLCDRDPSRVLSDLAAFPGQVHAVVLGGCLPAGVLVEPITVTQVGRDDPPGAVARAVFASLITHRPGSRVALPQSTGNFLPRRQP